MVECGLICEPSALDKRVRQMTPQDLTPSKDSTSSSLSSRGYGQFPEYDLYVVRRRRVWRPPTDVYETASDIVVKIEIAGVNEADLDITIADQCLVVTGHRKDPTGKLVYQNMEIHYGEFLSEVQINCQVEQERIEATYESGFLYVRLPKAPIYRVQVQIIDENRSE